MKRRTEIKKKLSGKYKCKVVLMLNQYHAMDTYGGVEVELHIFLISVLD
jgi:hypothetical protein